MMSESGEDTNGESTFEIIARAEHLDIQDSPSATYSTSSSIPPAPSVLPAFAALPQQQQNVSTTAFSQPNIESGSEKTPIFPPPSAGQTAGQNPFSIRSANAGYTRPQGAIVTPPMPPQAPVQNFPSAALPSANLPPPQMFMPAPPAAAPAYFSQTSESASMAHPMPTTGHAQQYSSGQSYGVELSMEGGPLSAGTGQEYSQSSGGVWNWFQNTVSGSQLLTKVAEKAKSSMDTMITTLDPQMKEYMGTSGSIEVVVASDQAVKISGVKDGFQRAFAHVITRGLGAPSSDRLVPPQPKGFENAIKGAECRIQSLRQSSLVYPNTPVIAVESFVVELTTDNWHEGSCVMLDDAARQFRLHAFSQLTPIPKDYIDRMKSQTTDQYPLKELGFPVDIQQVMIQTGFYAVGDWHQQFSGLSRQEILRNAAAAVAFMYKRSLGGF